MSEQTFADALSYISEKQYQLLLKKNRNYGNNLVHFGLRGVVMRLHDKYHRLETLVMGDKPDLVGESVTDTLTDLAGYCLVALALMEMEELTLEGTWRNTQPPEPVGFFDTTTNCWEALS